MTAWRENEKNSASKGADKRAIKDLFTSVLPLLYWLNPAFHTENNNVKTRLQQRERNPSGGCSACRYA